jgi:hypothetical protein
LYSCVPYRVGSITLASVNHYLHLYQTLTLYSFVPYLTLPFLSLLGAGKTTLCEAIAEQVPEVAYVSGRRMLHDAAARESTLVGKELRSLLVAAGIDPDAVKKVRSATVAM